MWKQINIYDGRYEIDESGNIRNTVTNNELHPTVFSNGYKTVTLSYNGQHTKQTVHRLVAETFLSNPNNLPVVMHLDNNKLNCHVSNLKFGSYSENNAQAVRDGLTVVPRPDNRKMYTLFHPKAPIEFDCYGVSEVINALGYGTDTCIRNYIFRQSTITSGAFKGWRIKLAEKGRTFNDHPLTVEGQPLM